MVSIWLQPKGGKEETIIVREDKSICMIVKIIQQQIFMYAQLSLIKLIECGRPAGRQF